MGPAISAGPPSLDQMVGRRCAGSTLQFLQSEELAGRVAMGRLRDIIADSLYHRVSNSTLRFPELLRSTVIFIEEPDDEPIRSTMFCFESWCVRNHFIGLCSREACLTHCYENRWQIGRD